MNPITLGVIGVTAAIAALAYNVDKGSQEQNEFNNALKATGDQAGLTEGALYTMGDSVAGSVHKSAEEVRGLELALVRTGKASGDNIGKMVGDAELLATAMGEKPAQALKTIESLTGDVSKKSAELNEQLHFLTEAQWLNIRALEEAGHQDEALSAALDALNSHLKSTTAEVGWLDGAFKSLKDRTDSFVESIRSLGRDQTAEEKLSKLKELLANPGEQAAIVAHGGSVDTGAINQQITALQRVVDIQKTLNGWATKNNNEQKQSIADDQTDGKKNDELSDAITRRTRETAALTVAKKALADATTADARASAQAEVAAKAEDLQNNANTIKRLQKQIDGPKPKGVSQLARDEEDVAAKVAEIDDRSKTNLIQQEIKLWEEKVSTAKAGSARYIAEMKKVDDLQSALKSAEAADDKKYAKADLELNNLKARDDSELAQKQAQYQRDGQLGNVDDQITLLKAQMSAEGILRSQDLAKLQEYYRERAEIIRQGAAAELQGKLTDAMYEKHGAESDKSMSQDQRAMAVEKANQKILDAQQAYDHAAQQASQDADKQTLQSTLETISQQVSAYRSGVNRIADSWRTAFEDMALGTKSWAQVVQSLEAHRVRHGPARHSKYVGRPCGCGAPKDARFQDVGR